VLLDDFEEATLDSRIGTRWRGISDRVMGGISDVQLRHVAVGGRNALELCGEVRLERNGGFVQAAMDLRASGHVLDASAYAGVALTVQGNGERYAVHLRTPDCTRPWQSYRAGFVATADWADVLLPFAAFSPHRLEIPLDRSRLRRIGLVAIGRAFDAELRVSELRLYGA
jgi:hypothetical protein